MAKRREILRAAAEAFREHGFAATGMREIAEKAGLSPANLYYYFRSKHDLLFFCQDQALDRLLTAAAEQDAEHAEGRLSGLIRAHVRCVLDEVDGASAHVAVDALPPELRRKIAKKRDRYERAVRKLVSDGVAEGEFRACDPTLVARALLGALNWTVQWYRPGGRTSPARVADEYAEYLVQGLVHTPQLANRSKRKT